MQQSLEAKLKLQLSQKKRPHYRKCKIAWGLLANHNHVISPGGARPTETTAGTTTK